MESPSIQCLISLPPGSAEYFSANPRPQEPGLFFSCDPPGGKLGSGGGVAQMLVEGWRATGQGLPFSQWLQESRKLIVLGGGQSRRLPAYAAMGKPFIPIPVLQGSFGQQLDQTLLDLQLETYRSILRNAPDNCRVMIASGDVLLRFGGKLPPCPGVDILMLGMAVDEETASHFGVFFSERASPERLAFFLQKPAKKRIRELSTDYGFLVDTGMWLLGEKAVELLLRRCGWDADRSQFARERPETFELYSRMGLGLGDKPAADDPDAKFLSCHVAALAEPEFYHLGTSRQLIESVCAMQNREARRATFGSTRIYPDRVVQNAIYDAAARREASRMLWIENATVPPGWHLASEHVITGAPPNAWDLALEQGVCLDFVPIGDSDFCVRAYGIDDSFSGVPGDVRTLWLARPAAAWFAARGITWEMAGVNPAQDIYQAPLFPVLPENDIDPRFLEWIFAGRPVENRDAARRWRELPRLSAEEINIRANLKRLEAQRTAICYQALRKMHENRRSSVFYRLNLEEAARLYGAGPDPLPPADDADPDPLGCIHDHMWRAAVLRRRNQPGASEEEGRAFRCLSQAILDETRATIPQPRGNVLADQIVWGRAPARLDFAGGWTDTPPYCLQHGGKVVNVAVNLNGQPPIQVFAKLCARREIVIRSIDLGIEERIAGYEQLGTYATVGSEFALAKAALVLAGFLPRFYQTQGADTLARLLDDFGGGIEISLLAAIPQGSGLGTSSILAATLLGVLSELCGLGWDTPAIVMRAMALEQMLTTGGGWQDQVGGILGGVKFIKSFPGIPQNITARWLTDSLFSETHANRAMLLYYTGVTRLAKNILQEIVRGMFLNNTRRLGVLREIGENAEFVTDAIQRIDWDSLCEGVRRSWELNQRLDPGTNPPAIQAILDPIGGYLSAVKLLGAGGGGYMVLLAKDEEAALRIRRTLAAAPPNPKARFVDLSVSKIGLEITRS